MLAQVQRYDIGHWTRHVLERFAGLSVQEPEPKVLDLKLVEGADAPETAWAAR